MTQTTKHGEPRKVHVTDADGNPKYTRLFDDGGPILDFEGGGGFICRRMAKSRGWKILPGWPKTPLEREQEAREERARMALAGRPPTSNRAA